MNQFLEAAASRSDAIWSNKLRSFLTVLGNIVAVTSIHRGGVARPGG
jgi:hypothetical protein